MPVVEMRGMRTVSPPLYFTFTALLSIQPDVASMPICLSSDCWKIFAISSVLIAIKFAPFAYSPIAVSNCC